MEIITVLKTFLPRNLYALDFSTDHYRKLLEKLNIINNEELFNLKRGAIAEAIIEYFTLTFQNISIELSSHNCSITKHFTDKSGNESLDRVLHNNSMLLIDISQKKDEYRVLPYLLSIPEATRDALMKGFIDKNESIDKARTLTRIQSHPIFNLGERDIIFFLRGRIWIRYYIPPKKVSDGEDKRYAGESEEVLAQMYQTYFPNGMWEDIESILQEVIAEKLNFSSIDNMTFSKTFIPVFRGMIEVLLIDIVTPEERERIEGFTGYVLRKYFDRILLFTAKNLLTYVETRDKNAETFIKYFSEDVVIDSNGNRIQKYAIVDLKQQKWNYAAIHSILMQYKQAKLRIQTQKEAIASAGSQVHESEEELKDIKNRKLEQEEKINEIKKLISENEIIESRNRKKKEIQTGHTYTKQHDDLLNQKKHEINQLDLINNRIKNKLVVLTQRKKKLAYEIKIEKNLIEQTVPIKETYEGIAHGLALVLTKR